MKAADIRVAVTRVDTPDIQVDEALRIVLPVLRALWSDLPWWRKVVVGLQALIQALETYLGEEG